MGGMGGTSDFIDRNLMNGSTSRFGNTAGRYDSGKASGAEVARDAAWFGANLVNNAFFLKDMGTLGIGLAKNGWKAAANALKQGGCFVAGTQVQVLADETASAKTSQKKHIKTKSNRVISKPIEKIQKGDVVASKNEKTGKIEWKHVDHTTIRTVDLTLTVHLADANTGKELEAITATREHPFYVEGKGFVPAGGLAIGNAIVTRAGPTLKVKQIEWHRRPEGYKVYNLVVEDDHTYFVGKVNGGVWVHNPGACSKVYEATLNPGAGGGVVAGRQLTRAEAVEAINRGKDVVADSRNLARSLAKTASGNSRPIGPEIHGNPIDGFMDHYHPDPRNGSHIFFP